MSVAAPPSTSGDFRDVELQPIRPSSRGDRHDGDNDASDGGGGGGGEAPDDGLVALQLQLQIYIEAGQQDRIDPDLLQQALTGDRRALEQAISDFQNPGRRRNPGGRLSPAPAPPAAAPPPAPPRADRVNEDLQNVLNRRSIFDSKPLIAFLILYGVLELGFSIATLLVSINKPCDRPLRFFILAFSLRQMVLIPINVRRFMDPNGFIQAEDVQRRAWVQIFWLVCFIIGHLWVYSSETCRDTDPITYWWSFVLIVIVYIDLCFPILLLLLLCACWPCVAYTLRRMQPNPGASDDQIRGLPTRRFDPDEMRRRRKEIRRARKAASLAQSLVQGPSTSPRSRHQSGENGNAGMVDLEKGDNRRPLLEEGSLSDYPVEVEVEDHPTEAKSSGAAPTDTPTAGGTAPQAMVKIPIHSSPSTGQGDDDSEEEEDDEMTCSICLQDFLRGDQLICLPCSHDFHKKCCENWLKLHSTCPLCRKDINQR